MPALVSAFSKKSFFSARSAILSPIAVVSGDFALALLSPKICDERSNKCLFQSELVGRDIEQLDQLSQRLVASQGGKRHLRLELRRVTPPLPSRQARALQFKPLGSCWLSKAITYPPVPIPGASAFPFCLAPFLRCPTPRRNSKGLFSPPLIGEITTPPFYPQKSRLIAGLVGDKPFLGEPQINPSRGHQVRAKSSSMR